MTLTKADKAVIAAFTEHRPASSKALSTDGHTLNGHWMGGDSIAHWSGSKIHFGDLGSKAAQTVQRALAKETPRNWLAHNPSPEAHHEYLEGDLEVARMYRDAAVRSKSRGDNNASKRAHFQAAQFAAQAMREAEHAEDAALRTQAKALLDEETVNVLPNPRRRNPSRRRNPAMPFGFDSFEEYAPTQAENKKHEREQKLRHDTAVAVGNWYGKPAYLYIYAPSSVVLGHYEDGHFTVANVVGEYPTLKEAKAALKSIAAKLLRGDGSVLMRNPSRSFLVGNPSSGSKQRSRGVRGYVAPLAVDVEIQVTPEFDESYVSSANHLIQMYNESWPDAAKAVRFAAEAGGSGVQGRLGYLSFSRVRPAGARLDVNDPFTSRPAFYRHKQWLGSFERKHGYRNPPRRKK